MDRGTAQQKQLYAELKLIYLEMLTLTRDLKRLCVDNNFLAANDREKLAELLLRREKLMEQAAARQKEIKAAEQGPGGFPAPAGKGAVLLPEQGSLVLPGQGSPLAAEQPGSAPRRLEVLLKEIIDLNTVTGQALRRSLQHAAAEISKVQMAKKANKAYQNHAYQPEGFFIDSNK